MPPYLNVGERIRERFLALGYGKPDGELDVERFCWDWRFGRTNVYNWLSNTTVPFKDLTRLCDVLQCSERWLLMGAERKKVAPRQGRGRVSLWLGLPLAAAALLSPSVAPAGEPLPDGARGLHPPSYRKWRLHWAMA